MLLVLQHGKERLLDLRGNENDTRSGDTKGADRKRCQVITPPNISEGVTAYKQSKIGPRATNSNRASSIGDECDRKLVYARTRWRDQKMHNAVLQGIFDAGNVIEEAAIQDMKAAGYKIVQQQRDLALPAYELTGHVDCMIEVEGSQFPIDVKSMSPHIWNSVNDPIDFFDHKYPHVRHYPAQAIIYGYMAAADWSALFLVNKVTFETKTIWFKIEDFKDYVDALKEKASNVTNHVRAGTLPDRIDDLSVCDKCPYNGICLPDKQFGPAIEIVNDPDFLTMLERWEATKASSNEHDELDEEIKAKIKNACLELERKDALMAGTGHKTEIPAGTATTGIKNTAVGPREFLIGNFSITVSNRKKKEWVVDENIKKMIGQVKETPYKAVTIKRREA